MEELIMISKMSFFLLILAGLLSSCGHHCEASFSRKTFVKVDGSGYGSDRLGSPWTSKSRSDCFFSCWTHYSSKCQTFMYNSDTGLCTPGSFLKAGTLGTQLAPTSPEGDLFAPSTCDTSDGFEYITSANVSACINVSSFILNANDAVAYCFNLGAHLFVSRSMEKVDLLPHDVKLTVGLSDEVSEGTFVWQDTGDAITDDLKTLFFRAGEPNNQGGNENCVTITPGTNNPSGNDYRCLRDKYKFVCERPVLQSAS
ncbi:C-type lectin-related protein 4 [Elysia marginata]|uniref:C-type lectin-related protein 4 n=1 Tax=Elysia marginata TaxID=1093978 RepID=A0AAV4IRY2_9GAST|nr:C-type lectin-related protein 4 [Elysia marginata]